MSDCAVPLPITVSPADQLTETTARQILAADLWYKARCMKAKV